MAWASSALWTATPAGSAQGGTTGTTFGTNILTVDPVFVSTDPLSSDFLDVDKYPTAKFVSTSYTESDGKGELKGNLTLHGVTKPVTIEVRQIGAGTDPWGGFRRGFEGKTSLTLADFNINYNLGPSSREVELILHVEGIRQ